MKPRRPFRTVLSAAMLTMAFCQTVPATPVLRSNTADNLNLTAAWQGGVLPGTANVATWDASSTLANTMGAANTWGALNLSAASGAVSISGANNLLLDHTTDSSTGLFTGVNSFTWGQQGVGGNFAIRGAAPSTSTAQGATFSGSGTVTISSTGTKNWSSDGSTNGVTQVDFTGTLALRGAVIPNAGTLPGNWLAFGGGGSSLAGDGAVTQTGSFALDLGDENSCGSFILTHGFNNKTLRLNRLSGTGSIRADWGVGSTSNPVPLSNRTIELNQADDTTVSGSILAHNGSGQRRNINFIKQGAGTLTLTGGLGTSAGTASLNFDIQQGSIQLGNGTATPGFFGALDPASTCQVSTGAEVKINVPGTFNWPHVQSGGGTIRVQGPGNVAFTGNSSTFAGNLLVENGLVRLGPSLGTAAVTMSPDTFLAAGLPATAGTSQIGSLTLADATESDFRIGATNDRIVVNGPLTPPADGGLHFVNLAGNATSGGAITLIDYDGPALSAAEFARFEIGSIPSGLATFELVNNVENTSIDVLVTLEPQVWTGSVDGVWDAFTTNWALASSPAVPRAFDAGRPARMDDNATRFDVTVDQFGISPLSLEFTNETAAYTLTGGPISGTSALVKKGAGKVTLAQTINDYTGGTQIQAGTLQIGNGGETGEIGGGSVQIAENTTLAYLLDANQTRDYKTTPRLRNVSGAGTIVLDGGFTLFNYTGGGLGFAEAGSWTNFSGSLVVKGGSEFRTIRNGRTAMGSGPIILGDATTSGHLAQIEGNWTWTNPISLVGPANEIRNRSAVAPRTLKLQGVLSGAGGLTFSDPAVAMTNNQLGFILTGENTFSGTLTILPGVPVRVGGVPGDTDINQSGAGTGGSLGTATILNEGSLTFSRSDTHTVSNPITGGGAVFVGLSTNNAEQQMTYSGVANHTGGTTLRAGTLTVAPEGSIGGSSLTVADNATLVVDGSSVGDATTLNLGPAARVRLGSGTETVSSLFINGEEQAAGTYGATGSGATFLNDTLFEGSGVLSVTNGAAPVNGYAAWAATHAPTGGPADDFDADGVPNAVEFILGGTKDTNDLGKLPLVSTPNGDFVVTFVRDQASKVAGVDVFIQVGGDLATWPLSYNVASAPEIAITDNGNGTETVRLSLPRGTDRTKFARMEVRVP